jgi:hypothetical protein
VGKLEAAVPQCGLDTFTALFHGVIGEADDIEVGHSSGAYIHLHFDQVGVDAINRSAERFEEHKEECRERLGAA